MKSDKEKTTMTHKTMQAVVLTEPTQAEQITLTEVPIPQVRPRMGAGKSKSLWTEPFGTDLTVG